MTCEHAGRDTTAHVKCLGCAAEKLRAKRAIDPMYGRSRAERAARTVASDPFEAAILGMRSDAYDRGPSDPHERRATTVQPRQRAAMDEAGIPEDLVTEFKHAGVSMTEYIGYIGGMLCRRALGLEVWGMTVQVEMPTLQRVMDYHDLHLEVRPVCVSA